MYAGEKPNLRFRTHAENKLLNAKEQKVAKAAPSIP